MKFPTNTEFYNLLVAGCFERSFYFPKATLDDLIRQAFGDILREVREERRLSQECLSNLSGVARQSISRYECRIETPSFKTIYRLVCALRIDIYEFLKRVVDRFFTLPAYQNQEVAEETARQRKVRRKALKDDSVLYEVNGPDKIKKAAESASVDEAKNTSKPLS